MKYLRFVLIGIFSAHTLAAHSQQISVQEVKDIRAGLQSASFSGRAEWGALSYYLQGVVEGVAAYQESAIKTEHSLVFCPPKGKGYSIDELMRILDQARSEDLDRPAALVILESYMRAYPCDQSSR